MTAPTQAQIDAAAKAIKASLGTKDWNELAAAALTAAAEVGTKKSEPLPSYISKGLCDGRLAAAEVGKIDWTDIDAALAVATAATIERCAQRLEEFKHRREFKLRELIAAIRALSTEKP